MRAPCDERIQTALKAAIARERADFDGLLQEYIDDADRGIAALVEAEAIAKQHEALEPSLQILSRNSDHAAYQARIDVLRKLQLRLLERAEREGSA